MYQPPGNRYHIEREFARGGIGILYLATDRNLNRLVALKRVRREASAYSEETEQKLVNEAQALSALQHPNVVTVYDVGLDRDGVYLVMEYVHGETLEQAVTRGAFTLDDFKVLVEHSLGGLHAAHHEGLIHRDIKPANLMVDWKDEERYTIKLLDFGLARFIDLPTVQTVSQAGSVMGTIYFMAPEQFEMKPIDQRTDLYSLGCVFYYCLTQKFPFEGEGPAHVMSAHLGGRFQRLGPLRPDIPHNVLVWVERLMARNPEERPASAREALESFQERAFVPHWVDVPSNVWPLTKPTIPEDPLEELPDRRKGATKSTRDLLAASSASASSPLQRNVIPLVILAFGMLLLAAIAGVFYFTTQDPPSGPVLSTNEQAAVEELEKALHGVVSQESQLISEAIY